MTALPPDDDDDNISSVLATSSLWGTMPVLVRQDFPLVTIIMVGHVGLLLPLPLPPKPMSQLRESFYGPARPPQAAFLSP